MSTVARSTVRIINHSLGIDDHHIAYGIDDRHDHDQWQEGFLALSEKHSIPSEISWIEEATEKSEIHSGRLYGAHHENGWLFMIRHDRIDTRRASAAVNDNEPEDLKDKSQYK